MFWEKAISNLLYKITHTLRGKLAFWYFTSIGIIIMLFAVAVSILLWITLQDQIDHHVQIAVNEASEIVQNFQGVQRDGLIKNLVSTQGMTVVVLSPDGAPLLETNSPDIAPATEHQLQRILTSSSLYESSPVSFTEGSIRFAAKPIQINAGKGIVAVGYSTQILSATFIKMFGVVAGVLVLLVLPLTFIGYKLLKRQLQPLESIADQARAVSDLSSLSKRIYLSSHTQELKTIQRAFNTMLAKLEKVFKNERVFFSDAAHTLKTPLAVLRSQIENSGIETKSRVELLTTIDASNDAIADLLLLANIKNEPQDITAFSLTDLMVDLSELAYTLGEDKDLKIILDIQKGVRFKADKKLLQRAISNVVHNAVIYNKPKGTINLILSKHSDRVTIVVKSTGIGIKKREQSQVFTRFFRGSNVKRNGSGLGLSISKAVIESLGGTISITSSVKSGTTVSITFPTG